MKYCALCGNKLFRASPAYDEDGKAVSVGTDCFDKIVRAGAEGLESRDRTTRLFSAGNAPKEKA